MLLWVPAAVRNDNDPAHQADTSNDNHFVGNVMGRRPDGTVDRNGIDFWWDEQGIGNCWQGNVTASASDPAVLPTCDHPSSSPTSRPDKTAMQVPCTAWDPQRNPRPIGCDWFDLPPEPR
jgi:hypothetical protein